MDPVKCLSSKYKQGKHNLYINEVSDYFMTMVPQLSWNNENNGLVKPFLEISFGGRMNLFLKQQLFLNIKAPNREDTLL